MANDQIKQQLEQLAAGAKVHVKLDNGTEISGEFKGLDGAGFVHVDREDGGSSDSQFAADRVETVLMDVSSSGVE